MNMNRPFLAPPAASAPANSLVKAITALVIAQGTPHRATSILKSMGDDEPAEIILKAATTPATTTQTGWAAELAQRSVADYVVGLGPLSAGSQLLREALVIPQERGELGTSVPSMLPSATGAAFVTEGEPIPVKAFTTTLVNIPPGKVAALSAYTREMTLRSSIEAVLRRTLAESVSLALDAALFGTAAAGAAPAGLRNGVTGLTAATGGGEAAMLKDLGALAAAVAGAGGDRIAFVADAASAVKIRLKAGSGFNYPVFATAALPANTVMAIALDALAVAIDPTPEIEVANAATLHFEDAEPLHIGTAPSTVAAPTHSLFQTDAVALRIALGVSWAPRASGAVAFTTGVTW